jgi:hypothetical protein
MINGMGVLPPISLDCEPALQPLLIADAVLTNPIAAPAAAIAVLPHHTL